jgi:hypothetical protein
MFSFEAIKKAHDSTRLTINKDETCQWMYWLFIFPESVVLDNVNFSGDPVKIGTKVIGMAAIEDMRGLLASK